MTEQTAEEIKEIAINERRFIKNMGFWWHKRPYQVDRISLLINYLLVTLSGKKHTHLVNKTILETLLREIRSEFDDMDFNEKLAVLKAHIPKFNNFSSFE